MNVPVLWVTNHADVLARGNWDHAMLEAVFDRSLWRVPGGVDYVHHEIGAGQPWPQVDGAVVVVSGRNHASPEDLHWLNHELRALRWVVLVTAGDEEATFPWHRIRHERMKVWGMGAKPVPGNGVDVPLGSGWPPGIRDTLAASTVLGAERELPFFFSGQVTHERRHECSAALARMPGGRVIETERFTEGISQKDYWRHLASAKLAPCPSGPCSPDSFRLYEALEAGCVPIADAVTPLGPEPGYWTYVCGEPPPFPEITDWSTLPTLAEALLSDWPANANRVLAWWGRYKRDLAWRMGEHVQALHGHAARTWPSPDDEITVVVPVSPSPLHPSTEHLEATIASVRRHLPLSEIIVAADPPRPELRHRRRDWQEFLRRALWLSHHRWHNVAFMLRPKWGHQANVVADALELVRTPMLLLVEYDAPLTDRPIDWEGCLRVIHSGTANVVRFSHEASVLPDHEHLMLSGPQEIDGVPLIPTMQYSARPHLAPVWLYRDLLARWFDPRMRTMLEDRLYAVILSSGVSRELWERWRIWLYADTRPDGSMQRSIHLDGRAGDPKFEMRTA